MSKTAGQWLGLLRRISPYILHAQRAIIYKSMIRSKMEYASSAWIGATPTSLGQLDSIQNRAKRVIGLPTNEYEDHRMQPSSHRRAVGAATFFYRMFYKEAPWVVMPADARHSCPWPQVAMVCEIPWPSSESPKIKPCQPCKIISTIYGPIMEFSSCPNSSH